MNKLEILKNYEFFNKSDSGFQKEILDQSLFVKLDPGTKVFKEGDICKGIGLLGRGEVRVYKKGDTGREITLYYVQPGEVCILAASSILSDIPYRANAVVEAETEALILDSASFKRYIERNHHFRKYIYEILSTRLSIILHVLDEIIFKKLDKRLANYLIDQSGAVAAGSSVIKKTHGQIAQDLGSAREVISRILKEFEQLGAIEIKRGMIKLTNVKQLQEYGKNSYVM